MKRMIRVGRYLNKSRSTQEMLVKWACLNPEIKDGDVVRGRTFLLNLEKMNRCVFFPVKNNLVIRDCHFTGAKEGLKGDWLAKFKLMEYRDDLSVEII